MPSGRLGRVSPLRLKIPKHIYKMSPYIINIHFSAFQFLVPKDPSELDRKCKITIIWFLAHFPNLQKIKDKKTSSCYFAVTGPYPVNIVESSGAMRTTLPISYFTIFDKSLRNGSAPLWSKIIQPCRFTLNLMIIKIFLIIWKSLQVHL